MFEVSLTSLRGDKWLLTGSDLSSPVVSPAGALRELFGRPTHADVLVPGRHGAIPGRAQYPPIMQDIEFYLNDMRGTVDLVDVYNRFRRGWPAVFEVVTDHPLGKLFLPVESRGIPGTAVDPSKVDSIVLPVTVFNKDGLFRTVVQSGEGAVTVTNLGVETVYPRVSYSGAGGEVVSPSGAVFTLPASDDDVVVDLDPRRLRLPGVFPEGVPPGESGQWLLPAGASLLWHLWVADPWA